MIYFLEFVFGFLFARALWDFAKKRAEACEMSVLRWMLETTALLAALTGLACIFFGAVIYVFFR